jgi:hypothetical protein
VPVNTPISAFQKKNNNINSQSEFRRKTVFLERPTLNIESPVTINNNNNNNNNNNTNNRSNIKCGTLDLSQPYGHLQLVTGIALPLIKNL